MIRATTGGVMKTYRSNLMNSFIHMNKSMNTILSQRTFNSFAEDPAAAAKTFRLRKSRMMVESQLGICSDVLKKYETAVACLQSNDDVLCTKKGEYGYYMKTLTGTTLEMLNDPTGDARVQLSKVLDQMSQSIIQTMNQKYGDNFIFAGADGHNVPFEIKDNKLYYRGVPVDAAMPKVFADGNNSLIAVSADGKVISDPENYDGDVYYLNMNNTKIVTKEEYDKLYTVPKLQMDPNDPNKFLECDYDADGNMVYMPGGRYYMPVDENDNPTGEPILKEAYEEIVARHDSLLKDDSSASQLGLIRSLEDIVEMNADGITPKEYNADGVETPGGGYYHYTVDGQSYVVSKAVYEEHMKEFPSDGKFPMFYADGHVEGEEAAGGLHNIGGEPVKYLRKDEDGNLYWLDSAEYEEAVLVHANADGTYDPEGDCYVVFDQSQLMTPEEYDQQKLDYEKLQYLAHETDFVDIGYGFQEDPVTGKLIESSAFNSALNGIVYLGYGLDEDGDPKNLYSLVQKMREVSESVPEAGKWDDSTWNEFDRLVGKFEKAVSNYQTEFVNLDASTGKLSSQEELLVENYDNVWEEYSAIEDVDAAEAITAFLWAQYAYNSALRVGNSVLSQSLMDYLN